MSSTAPPAYASVQNRRVQLKSWIDVLFEGNQAAFGASTNDGKTQINQGEVSGLLKEKSFGENRARRLEQQSYMPPGYLDSQDMPGSPPPPKNQAQQTTYGAPQPVVPLARPIIWPFHLVSYGRLQDLKRSLGTRAGNEAIRDLDKYLDSLVAKWEREAQLKKNTSHN